MPEYPDMKYRKPVSYSFLFYFALVIVLSACNGPRNIYSASPLIAPMPMQKGSTGIDLTNFTHIRKSAYADTVVARDYGFGLSLSHMISNKTMLLGFTDLKKERNRNLGGWGNPFDSSEIYCSRYAVGLGIGFFSNTATLLTPSLILSTGLHHMNLTESGEHQEIPYHRFYKMYQLSFSAQGNLLFKINKKLNLAYSLRLTAVKFFNAKSDFSSEEKYNTGLHRDGKVQLYRGLLGIYTAYHPFKNVPVFITGQVFTDFTVWDKMMAKWEPGRTYMKGTGAGIGLRYVLN